MKQVLASIISNTEFMPGVNLIWLEAADIAATAQPGQFITVCCEGLMLRRPFSVHQADSSRIALLFKIVGRGTLWLAQRQRGDKVDILGPLGNGFSVEPEARNLLLVAGGIGIAPLVFLAQRSAAQHSVTLIHGASMASKLYPFSSLPLTLNPSPSKGGSEMGSNLLPPSKEVQFIPVTEDGSAGKKGMVTDILPDFLDWADQVYACGPVDMYKQLTADSYQLKATACHSEGALACCHSERSEESGTAQGKLRDPKNLLFSSFLSSGLRASAHQETLRFCHSEPFACCHSEGEKRPKNLAQDNPELVSGEESHAAQGRVSKESKLKRCQVSLEVRMGCGIGACYGCTINTRKGLKKVCRDGPVFELDDILWEEVRI